MFIFDRYTPLQKNSVFSEIWGPVLHHPLYLLARRKTLPFLLLPRTMRTPGTMRTTPVARWKTARERTIQCLGTNHTSVFCLLGGFGHLILKSDMYFGTKSWNSAYLKVPNQVPTNRNSRDFPEIHGT